MKSPCTLTYNPCIEFSQGSIYEIYVYTIHLADSIEGALYYHQRRQMSGFGCQQDDLIRSKA